jgi:tetratricopeptide (TPR) repeat protein
LRATIRRHTILTAVKTHLSKSSARRNLATLIHVSQQCCSAARSTQNRAALFLLLATLAGSTKISLAHTQSDKTVAASVDGVVRDSSGHPVANASVSLLENDSAISLETRTIADGTFAFAQVPAGAFTIKAQNAGVGASATQSLELAAGEKKHVDLVLAAQTPGSSAKSHPAPASSSDPMDFSDQPNFTVAGMTDWSNLGLHGSDATTRTSETLAKETAALKSGSANEAPTGTSNAAAAAHRVSGDRDEHSGDPVAAVREYQQAARLDPNEENYFAWGSELLLHRAAQPAAEVFTRGSALHPKSARMLAGLGAALYADGLYDDAARRLCQASDLNPDDPSPYLFLGKMEETTADPAPCAEEKLARFAGQQSGNAFANYYYAVGIWKRDRRSDQAARLPQAEALLEKAVSIDPAFAEAYLQLGILYSAQGDFPRARQTIEKAVAINPHLTAAHYQLGQVYKRTNEEKKARQEFAIYKQNEKEEADALERQRRELRQFLIILKDQPLALQPK